MTPEQAAHAAKGKLFIPEGSKLPGSLRRFVIDSRSIQAGDVFIPVKGARFDGHDFIEQAHEAGASLVVSEKNVFSMPCILVDDTRRALGMLAAAWAGQFDLKRIAITGSAGKTTVKELVASILESRGSVVKTEGNQNNEIGVPLTLFKVTEETDFGVFELGANHLGEIAYTSSLVKPDIAVITSILPAHVEGFGSLEKIKKAKSEIYSGLNESGTAVINLDEPASDEWLSQCSDKNIVTYAVNESGALIQAKEIQLSAMGSTFVLEFPDESVEINLSLLGSHNILNAVSAAAVSFAAGSSVSEIKKGLERVAPVKGRLCPVAYKKSILVDDTYNANPGSMSAAVNFMKTLQGNKLLVLGDMLELGDDSRYYHESLGQLIAESGIEVIALGEMAGFLVEACLAAGGQAKEVVSHEAAADEVRNRKTDYVLFKGSRSSAMEKVLELLVMGENE